MKPEIKKLISELESGDISKDSFFLRVKTIIENSGKAIEEITDDEISSVACTLSEELDAQEQAFYLAGFQTAFQWLKMGQPDPKELEKN